MTTDLILYTNPMSRGRITRWMLEEVGQDYSVENVDYGAIKAASYLAINPMGKVPALRHKDALVTETAAICAYLAAAFPQAGLAPDPGTAAHGDYLRWLFFAAGPVEAAITAKSLNLLAPPDKARMAGYGTYECTMDALEGAVAGKDYIAGGRFSAADVYVGSHIGFGIHFKTIEPRPAFVAYWERLAARPAQVRAAALDDAAMPTP